MINVNLVKPKTLQPNLNHLEFVFIFLDIGSLWCKEEDESFLNLSISDRWIDKYIKLLKHTKYMVGLYRLKI